MQDAFQQGYTRMQLIDANAIISINVGLLFRQAVDADPAYDYSLNISPVSAASLTCDLNKSNGNAIWACHVSLFLQFPTFERQLSLLTPLMTGIVSDVYMQGV